MEAVNKTVVEKEGHWPYVLKRALPVGCITLSAGYAANRYIIKHYPKSAPRNVSMRTFLMIGSFLMGFVTTTEVYSLKYERMVMNKINNIDERQIRRDIQLPKTVTDEALEYINNNRFKVFLSAWLASLAGAGYMVSRDRYMTTSQKVVQARMYAQGFTLLLIVGSAGLAMLDGKPKSNAHVFKDETWKTLINDDSGK
ncbi:uncharacterized protein V1513DRAFT_422759 [Lipomyces chichibuensis]|uniref:uncharacterized protein n=1 Tax=Lipomyces chichibuensis TaxID=1546026 RepID=UPI003343B51A